MIRRLFSRCLFNPGAARMFPKPGRPLFHFGAGRALVDAANHGLATAVGWEHVV
jgi:hypothetical protein